MIKFDVTMNTSKLLSSAAECVCFTMRKCESGIVTRTIYYSGIHLQTRVFSPSSYQLQIEPSTTVIALPLCANTTHMASAFLRVTDEKLPPARTLQLEAEPTPTGSCAHAHTFLNSAPDRARSQSVFSSKQPVSEGRRAIRSAVCKLIYTRFVSGRERNWRRSPFSANFPCRAAPVSKRVCVVIVYVCVFVCIAFLRVSVISDQIIISSRGEISRVLRVYWRVLYSNSVRK